MKATESDWEETMQLAYQVFMQFESEEYGEEGTESFYELISSKELKQMFLIGEYPIFVAKSEGKIVGMISIRSGNHISLLFVDGKFHRNGIATALVEELIAFIMEKTRYRYVTVNASPYGEPFYHEFGFVDTDKKVKEDGIIYTPMEYQFY